jgi:DNA-binding protein
MDNKYRKVRPAATEPTIIPGELHISPRRPTKYYVKDAVLWFKKSAGTIIVLKGSGWALSQTVAAAEDIKRAIKGLHQIATYGTRTVTDEFEPIEAGLEKMSKERQLSTLEIRLSIRPMDNTDPGYQAPLDAALVKEWSVAEAEAIV